MIFFLRNVNRNIHLQGSHKKRKNIYIRMFVDILKHASVWALGVGRSFYIYKAGNNSSSLASSDLQCLPLTYWEMTSRGTGETLALMFTLQKEKTQMLFPTNMSVTEGHLNLRVTCISTTSLWKLGGRSHIYLSHPCILQIQNRAWHLQRTQIYLSTE